MKSSLCSPIHLLKVTLGRNNLTATALHRFRNEGGHFRIGTDLIIASTAYCLHLVGIQTSEIRLVGAVLEAIVTAAVDVRTGGLFDASKDYYTEWVV